MTDDSFIRVVGPIRLKENKSSKSRLDALMPYYVATRWLFFMDLASKMEWNDLSAFQSLALLKCIPLIPKDKVRSDVWNPLKPQAFYLAGIHCRSAGWIQTAMVLLNQYLDIVDAFDEGLTTQPIDQNFAETEIP